MQQTAGCHTCMRPVTCGDPGDGPKADRVSWPIVSIPGVGDGVSWRSADFSAQWRGPRAGWPAAQAYGCRSPLVLRSSPPWVAGSRYAAKRSPFVDGERASPGVSNLPSSEWTRVGAWSGSTNPAVGPPPGERWRADYWVGRTSRIGPNASNCATSGHGVVSRRRPRGVRPSMTDRLLYRRGWDPHRRRPFERRAVECWVAPCIPSDRMRGRPRSCGRRRGLGRVGGRPGLGSVRAGGRWGIASVGGWSTSRPWFVLGRPARLQPMTRSVSSARALVPCGGLDGFAYPYGGHRSEETPPAPARWSLPCQSCETDAIHLHASARDPQGHRVPSYALPPPLTASTGDTAAHLEDSNAAGQRGPSSRL